MTTQQAIWTIIYVALLAGGGWMAFKYWSFFKDAYRELRYKVTWPGWKEVQGTTIIVLIATGAFAIYLFLCDVLFQYTIMNFLKFVHGS